MVLQEEELYEFMRNMTTSTGKAPLDAICKARWRVEQLNVATNFIEIFDDIEVVMLEGQEANQPSSYQPKQWASFKPPKHEESLKKFTTKKVAESKKKTWSRENSKSKEIDDVQKEVEERPNAPDVVEEHSIEDTKVDESQNNGVCQHRMEQNRKKKACCAMCAKQDGRNKSQTKMKQSEGKDGKEHTESIFERAARIMTNNIQKPPPKVERKNPPLIFTNGLGINVCKGCPKRITKEQEVYLNSMVFCWWGPGGFINPKTQKHCMRECNIHFHLKKTCLRGYDQAVEFKDITMTDEVFDKLSDERMEVLHKEGILQHNIKNKSNA